MAWTLVFILSLLSALGIAGKVSQPAPAVKQASVKCPPNGGNNQPPPNPGPTEGPGGVPPLCS
jgi:hypothetical protein